MKNIIFKVKDHNIEVVLPNLYGEIIEDSMKLGFELSKFDTNYLEISFTISFRNSRISVKILTTMFDEKKSCAVGNEYYIEYNLEPEDVSLLGPEFVRVKFKLIKLENLIKKSVLTNMEIFNTIRFQLEI